MNPLLLSLLFAIAAISTIVGLSKILPDNLFPKKEPQKATDTTDIPKIPSDTIEKIPNPPTPTEKIEKTDIPTTPSDKDKNTQNPITPTEKIENTEKTDNGKIGNLLFTVRAQSCPQTVRAKNEGTYLG